MKLSFTLINSFKPKAKPYKETDGNGLIMIINPNGSKWWRFNFRYEGKQKTLSMGVYPDVGLADARDKVHEARKLLAQGIDPSSIRKAKQVKKSGVNSFESVANRWHGEMMADGEWSDKHAKTIMTSLKRNVFPYVGNNDISEILPTELKAVFERMADRGTTELLKRVKQRCSLVFNFAIGEGLINGNPTTGIRIRKHHTQNYHHITHKELPELITAIENGELEPTAKTGLMIALLTFQRTNEIRYASWDEIDFDAATWTIPAHRMKMKREHVRLFSSHAIPIDDFTVTHPIY